ncbi:MAG: thiol-disulfide isomerase, partial [Acidobacteria bacterium]|nr:thiol-disulfide isomerase [Acidobacteriota bacterium]
YFLKDPLPLKKGTVISCTAWFDNSANNRFNPDPSKTITWGDQSWEEMNVGFMEIAIPANADPDIVKLSGTTRPAGGRQ